MIGGVAIIPEAADARCLVTFRETHSRSIGGPAIGIRTHPPHVSVMQCPVRAGVPHHAVLRGIRNALPADIDGRLVMTDLSYQPVGWLFVNLALAPWLRRLHDTTVDLIAPYVDLTAIVRDRDFEGYTAQERRSYLTYGYRYAGPAFKPHITLGRVEPDEANALDKLRDDFREQVGKWTASPKSLIFYEAGAFGVVERTVAAIAW